MALPDSFQRCGARFVSQGFSDAFMLRLLEALAIAVAATAVFAGVVVGVATRLADWREPEGEAEFEEVVMRSERRMRCAAQPSRGFGMIPV